MGIDLFSSRAPSYTHTEFIRHLINQMPARQGQAAACSYGTDSGAQLPFSRKQITADYVLYGSLPPQ